MNTYVTNSQKQRGAALIIGLTLLMALTIIGISTLSTTSLEHRMVGNMTDTHVALNAAESATKIKRVSIENRFKAAGLPNCRAYDAIPCYRDIPEANWWDVSNWWSTNTGITFTENIDGPKSPPELIVEDVKLVKDHLRLGHDYKEPSHSRYYRITTRATGLSNNTQAVTQQVVKKRIN